MRPTNEKALISGPSVRYFLATDATKHHQGGGVVVSMDFRHDRIFAILYDTSRCAEGFLTRFVNIVISFAARFTHIPPRLLREQPKLVPAIFRLGRARKPSHGCRAIRRRQRPLHMLAMRGRPLISAILVIGNIPPARVSRTHKSPKRGRTPSPIWARPSSPRTISLRSPAIAAMRPAECSICSPLESLASAFCEGDRRLR